MIRSSLARATISGLRQRIQVAEEGKRRILEIKKRLDIRYENRGITREDYLLECGQDIDGRTIEEWLKYYDSYIKYCKGEIRAHNKHITNNKIMLVFFSLAMILTLSLSIAFIGPTIVGFVTQNTENANSTDEVVGAINNISKNETSIEEPLVDDVLGKSPITSGIIGTKKEESVDNESVVEGNVTEEFVDNESVVEGNVTEEFVDNESVVEGNVTESTPVNVTEINITEPTMPVNATEVISLEIITETNATIQTTQFQAILGKSVRWEKQIKLDAPENITIKLPKESINISVFKITEKLKEELEENRMQTSPLEEIDKEGFKEDSTPSQEPFSSENITEISVKNETKKQKAKFIITGQVVSKIEKKEFFLFKFLKNSFSTITGRVIDIRETQKEIGVIIEDNSTQYEIEYETPAPYATEENLKNGKRVKISSPENIHYKNVIVFTNLSENLNIKNPSGIKIYWIENNTFLPTLNILDSDSNGIYDYIEWIAPNSSNQTFDIIVITEAEHLDSNREFISNIYEEVKALDGNWSETIPDGDYVRVTFEINLTSDRDITIYPRTISGNPRIEVYEVNQSELIAEFTSLNDNGYNKIYLTNLVGSQDVFDLRIAGGSVEFDHIIDPISSQFGETGEIEIEDSLQWKWVAFSGSYSSIPVILATPVTYANCPGTCIGNAAGDGGMYPIPLVKDVSTTGFNFSMCIDGGSATCTTSAENETFHYFVFSIDEAANHDWIEVNRTTGVATTGVDTAETFTTSFTVAPFVWTQAQTYSQNGEIGAHAWVDDDQTTSGFNYVGCVHTGTGDTCDTNNPSETFGYVAIDTANANFSSNINFQTGVQDISNSDWIAVSFSPSYTTPRIMVTQNDDDGGQDPEYAWAKNVATTGAEIKYCEEDAGDVCNTHTSEKTYWFAMEDGNYISGLKWKDNPLNLSSGYVNNGNLTSITNITSSGEENNNTVLSCSSGNCSTITHDWIDGTNLTTDESKEINFTCDDSVIGVYSANFKVNSTQDPGGTTTTVNCEIKQPYGTLNVNLTIPPTGQTTNVNQNQTFWVNATITCTGITGSICGEVNATARYNKSNELGTGADGIETITTTNAIINNYTYLTGNESAGNLSIIVNDASEFAQGDEIFIIQMQDGTGIGTAGTYEFVTISNINVNTITLESALENTYGSGAFNSSPSSSTQIVRVPQYTNLTINSGASITAPDWDGWIGGIVIFKATDTVNMQGNINVSLKGFRGGDMGYANNEPGWEGEGIYGLGVESGTVGGETFPTDSNSGGAGQQGISHCGGGGGGGGYATQGQDGNTDDGGGGWNDTAWGGYAVGYANLSTMFLGGGGGGGGDDDDGGRDALGGDGGGMVYIIAKNISTASVYSVGQTKTGTSDCGSAEGSGGAGGTVWLSANDLSISDVSTIGGQGANVYGDTNGWGGDGSDGRIRLDYTTLTGNPTTPVNGYNNTDLSGMVTINTTSDTPFWTTSSNPQSCGDLNQGGSCQVEWLVNATGNISSMWEVVARFTSNLSRVSLNTTSGAIINITSGGGGANQLPVVYDVWNETMTDVSSGPTEDSATYIIINFSVSDGNGFGDLNDSTAKVNFTFGGESRATGCSRYEGAGNYANYTCNVTMWWFDGAGDWSINASIEDSSSVPAVNDTDIFYMGSTVGFTSSPSGLDWASISPGATNIEPSDYILMNNTGNLARNVEINATDLIGETNSAQALWAANFSTHTVAGCGGTTMVADAYTTIVGASLTVGNYTINDGTGQEQIYVCLEAANVVLDAQSYSTASGGSWTIRIFMVFLSVRRKKKKLAVKLDDMIKNAKAGGFIGEEELTTILLGKIKKQYTKNRDASIPLSIFSNEMGALEALTKYMRENLEMNYSEIGRLLSRDERTIWSSYNKAKGKLGVSFVDDDSGLTMPVSEFDDELTILERTIVYLKENMHKKYSEISEIINRDQRNIWGTYAGAKRKLERGNI